MDTGSTDYEDIKLNEDGDDNTDRISINTYKFEEIEEKDEEKKLSHFYLFLISFYWLSNNIFFAGMGLIIIPEVVKNKSESQKGSLMGMILFLSTLPTLIISPLIGAVSDRFRSRFDKFFFFFQRVEKKNFFICKIKNNI